MADSQSIPEHIYEPFSGKIDKYIATMVYQSTNGNEEATFSALLDMVPHEEAVAAASAHSTAAATSTTNPYTSTPQAGSNKTREKHLLCAALHDDDSGCEITAVASAPLSGGDASGRLNKPSRIQQSAQGSQSTAASSQRTAPKRGKLLGWTASAALPQDVQLAVSLWPVPSEDVFAVWGAGGGSADAAHLRLQEAYPSPYADAQGRMLQAYERVSACLGTPQQARETYLHLAEHAKPKVEQYVAAASAHHSAAHAVVAARHAAADKKGGHRVPHTHQATPAAKTSAGGQRQKGRRGGGRSSRRGGGRLQMASAGGAFQLSETRTREHKQDGTATLIRAALKAQEQVAEALEALCSDSRVLCLLMLESMGEAVLPGVCCLESVPAPCVPSSHSPAIVQQAERDQEDLFSSQGAASDGAAAAADEAAALAAAAKWETAEEAASIAAAAGLGVAEVRRGKVKVQLPLGRARQQMQYDAFGNPLVKRKGGRGGHATAPSPFGRSGGPVKEGEYDHVAMQEAFQQERSAGLEARRKREQVIKRAVAAKSAHGHFSGAVAGYFWEKAAALQDKAHAADAHESVSLLQRVNKHLPPSSNGVKLHEGCTVDLHGQLRRDGERMLNHVLIPQALANGVRTMQLVVGEGRHSSVGGDLHPLADTVKASLRAAVRDGRVKRFQRNGATFSLWL